VINLINNKRDDMNRNLSEEQMKLVIQATNDGMYNWDLQTDEASYSPQWKTMLGYTGEELENHIKTLHHLIHPADYDAALKQAQDFISGATGKYKAVLRLKHKLGHYITILSRAALLRDATGKATCFVGTDSDITEAGWLAAPQNLKEHYYTVFLNNFPFAAWIKDKEGRYLEANAKMAEYLGLASPDQLRGKTIHDFFQPEVSDLIVAEIQEVLNSGNTLHVEKEFAVTSGNRWFDIYQSPISIDGQLAGIVGCAWDITGLKQIETSLTESEERYRRVVEVSPEAIFVHSEGRFVFMNMAAAKLLGAEKPEELYGQLALDFVHPAHQDVVAQRIKNAWLHGDNPLIEEELVRLDGSTVVVEMVSVYLNYKGKDSVLAIARDISDRRRMQEELVKAQKFESLGVLAGGIAHDFNNILMTIIGNADLAMMRTPRESPIIENLRKIEQASAKAADLAKQMLAYSGKGRFVVEQIDLNILLEEMLHMLEVSISKKVVLRLNHTSNLPTVEVDATQLRQVVMNVVLNASEAIGDKSGVIAITTGCMNCDKGYLKDVWLIENISEGLYVYLEIADSGCGMSKETMEKIFEPFFTTKFTGRGLGMAAVMGIIRGHKGAIKVYSELGKGSTFKILLPASGKPTELFDHAASTEDWKGSGIVLLVDDEETVRGIGREMLQELGFETITANDGREALETVKNNPAITLVILDLTMPCMDGEQCFRELKQIRPDIKVIMSSGYNEQEVIQKFAGKGLSGFIQKPYKLSVLKTAVMAVDSTR
jgi:PAS domain S-box-containing protein